MEGAAALLSSQTRPGLPSSPPRRRRLACRLAGIAAALLVALVAAFWPGDLFWPGSAGPPPLGGGSEGSASATAEGPRLTKCPAGFGVADLAAADVALPAGHPPTGGAAPSADGDIGGAGVAVEELRRPTLFFNATFFTVRGLVCPTYNDHHWDMSEFILGSGGRRGHPFVQQVHSACCFPALR